VSGFTLVALSCMVVPSFASVRIVEPIVIPAAVAPTDAPKDETIPTTAPTPSAAPVEATANARQGEPVPAAIPPVQPSGTASSSAIGQNEEAIGTPIVSSDALEPEFAFASAGASYGAQYSPRAVAPMTAPRVASEQQIEREVMKTRMRMAVEAVAAEYGNPTFVEIFTNDPIRAQALRKRLQLLQNYEALVAEIAALEKQRIAVGQAVSLAERQRRAQVQGEIAVLEQKRAGIARSIDLEVQQQKSAIRAELTLLEREKSTLANDVESKRTELKTLQEKADALGERIRKAQSALDAAAAFQ
ncbi:MAG: hypothetical protein LBV12_06805, partial [Puniceicoccales bacterium]|nr:hypothetical protein [Puniceicoccales bacterium]